MGLYRSGANAAVRVTLVALMAAFVFGAVATAEAQSVTSNGNPRPAQVELTLRGTVTSAIAIEVSGSTNLQSGRSTAITGSGTAGVVNFGIYNIGGPLTNGEKFRVNAGPNKGSYLVATLTVHVIFSGGNGTAAVDVERTNACGPSPDVPCGAPGALFYAYQTVKQRNKNKTFLAWPDWKQYPEARYGSRVFDVPNSSYVPGAGNLDNAMTNGDYLEHQMAVWISDATAPGPFATEVTYTATRL
jgi:hypothetical protein